MKIQLNARVPLGVKLLLSEAHRATGIKIETFVQDALAIYAGVEPPGARSRERMLRQIARRHRTLLEM